MKTRLLLLTALLLSAMADLRAQFIVSDPDNTYQGVLSVRELKNTVSSLEEQKKRLDAGLDLVRKVNRTIRDCETMADILERQVSLNERCIELLSGNHSFSAGTLRSLSNTVRQIAGNNGKLARLARTVLSSSVQMNDSERLAQLQEIEKQMKEDEKTIGKVGKLVAECERLRKMLD